MKANGAKNGAKQECSGILCHNTGCDDDEFHLHVLLCQNFPQRLQVSSRVYLVKPSADFIVVIVV